MKLAMVGLGRMGGNMARRLRRGGIEVAGWNRTWAVTEALARETGLEPAASLEELVGRLAPPRVVWLMLPARPRRRRSTGWRGCSSRATSSSTAATPTTATRSGARASSARAGCASWTWASRAGSGGSRTATA